MESENKENDSKTKEEIHEKVTENINTNQTDNLDDTQETNEEDKTKANDLINNKDKLKEKNKEKDKNKEENINKNKEHKKEEKEQNKAQKILRKKKDSTNNPSVINTEDDKLSSLRNIFKYEKQNGKLKSSILLELIKKRQLSRGELQLSIFDENDEFRQRVKDIIDKKIHPSDKESKALAIIYGMACGDAIGSRVEFEPVSYHYNEITGPGNNAGGHFMLEPGQWTDDSSMGFCLCDSFLFNNLNWDPYDCMLRYLGWWYGGYNNAFRKTERHGSVGLGGNISQSLYSFKSHPCDYTVAGDPHTSGNGSLMRLSAIPILFHDDLEKGLEYAKKQSLVTHQGREAAECCRLATYIMIRGINGEDKKTVLNTLSDFNTDEISVKILSQSGIENKDKYKRNWNWKDPDYRYNEYRAKLQPGYIGSYAMDCLAMALHCVWSTNSFQEATLKAINLRGDADSVGSLTGQIAGSFYGIYNVPKDWIITVSSWDDFDAGIRALRLVNKKPVE